MPDLPSAYRWLADVRVPPLMLQRALALYGVKEAYGPANNATILAWAKEVGVEHEYTADSVPWCGLFMAVCARRADKQPPQSPLWALNWAKFGEDAGQPCLGDVLVFVRPGGGHVGLYIGEDKDAYHVLGGNTADAVSIARIDKHRLYAARHPIWAICAPPSRQPHILAAGGELSTNEA